MGIEVNEYYCAQLFMAYDNTPVCINGGCVDQKKKVNGLVPYKEFNRLPFSLAIIDGL